MRLMTHLSFNGQCEAAFRLYERLLGGEITMMLTYGHSPMAADSAGFEDRIVHATLKLGDQALTGADVRADSYAKPQGFAVQVNIDDIDQAEQIFETLTEDGVVQFAMQPTFWAERYGMVTDRFGIPWEINCGTMRTENT